IEKIRKHRNAIAHFKFFYKKAYAESNQLISKLNTAVVKAIKITEEKDFAEKNSEHIRNAMSEVSKAFKEFSRNIAQAITANIAPTLQAIRTIISPALEQITEACRVLDFSRTKQTPLGLQDTSWNLNAESPESIDNDICDSNNENNHMDDSSSDENKNGESGNQK
nr:hypothetical protein [bacterium]